METSLELALKAETYQSFSPQLKIAIFMGGLALLTSALVCMTAFTRIVIVLSFTRRALATQEIPPTPVLLGLSLILTGFVMGPTLAAIDQQALQPLLNNNLDTAQALHVAFDHLHRFMLSNTRKSDLFLFLSLARQETLTSPADVPLRILIPAFVISELKTSFIMGFCIFLPFLLVDLVISVILMSLGMMMMPPTVVSTPIKLLLFILMDGWRLIVQALCASFSI